MKQYLFNWIKRGIAAIVLVFVAQAAAFAQDQPLPEDDDKVKAALIGYLTRELDLTADEAQKFWPVYNQYRQEMRDLIREARKGGDQLEIQEKALNIRKKFRPEFARVLPQQKVMRVYPAEDKFRQLVMRKIEQRQQNRPMLRQQRRAGRPGQ